MFICKESQLSSSKFTPSLCIINLLIKEENICILRCLGKLICHIDTIYYTFVD